MRDQQPTPAPTVRNLREDDIDICARIYRRAYDLACYGGSWDEATAGRIIRELLTAYPQECFVAERDGVVHGFVLCSSLAGMRATVEELAVAPEYQEQGVGSALLDYVLTRYRRLGFTFVELIANQHAPAHEFYRKRGFTESVEYRLMTRPL